MTSPDSLRRIVNEIRQRTHNLNAYDGVPAIHVDAWADELEALYQLPAVSGEVDNAEVKRLAEWLDAKYRRHGEEEDGQAAEMMRSLYALQDLIAGAYNRQNAENAALRQRCSFLEDVAEEQKRTIGALTLGCEHLGGTTPILRKLGELEQRAEQAERERAADRADAERYRWIAARATLVDNWEYEFPAVNAWDIKPGPQPNEMFPTLHVAIDAARNLRGEKE